MSLWQNSDTYMLLKAVRCMQPSSSLQDGDVQRVCNRRCDFRLRRIY